MMTPEQAEQWAQALESGEYEQTRFKLGYNEEDTKFRCCLGVCVELFDPENVKHDERKDFIRHEEINVQNPSLGFQEKYLENNEITGMFTDLNDYWYISFEDIAKVVRHLYIYDRKEV